MNILRTIVVGLASFICVFAISGFVSLLSLDTTVMDRTVVKKWLSDSQIYDGKLVSALVQSTNAGSEQGSQQVPAATTLSTKSVETALNATYTPDFVQAQIETVINHAYDWTEGKVPEFTFSIPIDQKRDVLIQQLAKQIEPQIAALPVCRSVQFTESSTCRPASLTVEQLASQLTAQRISESGASSEPITNESFSKATPNQQNSALPVSSPLGQLPAIRKIVNVLLVALPIAAIISVAIILLVSAQGKRLLASTRLSRRVFFSMLFTFILSLVAVWAIQNRELGLSNMFPAQLGGLMIPLVKTIIIGISSQLALFSGIALTLSLATWIGLTIWRRKTAQPAPITQPPFPISSPVQPVQPESTSIVPPQSASSQLADAEPRSLDH
jgi:hypothetical protein